MLRAAWKDHGRTPAELFASLTPTQFLATLFRPAAGSGSIDRLAELTRLNRERGRRGERPVVPSWM